MSCGRNSSWIRRLLRNKTIFWQPPSAEDCAHLLPDLEPIPMPLGWVIYESGGLLKYLYFPMAQTAVCNRHHALEQQLCRWLLLSLERLKLERRVCECYAVVKKEYDRLLPVRIPL